MSLTKNKYYLENLTKNLMIQVLHTIRYLEISVRMMAIQTMLLVSIKTFPVARTFRILLQFVWNKK